MEPLQIAAHSTFCTGEGCKKFYKIDSTKNSLPPEKGGAKGQTIFYYTYHWDSAAKPFE